MSNPDRDLMIAVLVIQIQDYINKIPPSNAPAENYIFRNDKESDNYIFGFNSICRYIEIDPGRFRKKLKELKERRKNGTLDPSIFSMKESSKYIAMNEEEKNEH